VQFDAVRAIEACYAPAPDESAWLGGVAEAVAGMTRGLPPFAFTFQLDSPGRMSGGTLFPPAVEGLGLRDLWESADPHDIQVWFSAVPPVARASQQLRKSTRPLAERIRAMNDVLGVKDMLGVMALEPDGRGACISVPYVDHVRLPPQTLHQLARVTAHLGTAVRLHRRAPSAEPENPDVEAVLDPGGKVHHATGRAREAASREALAGAVRAVERARGRLRRTSPDAAVESWRGLVEGRWSLVDQGESDGRRFILARRNEPGARDPKALLPRERDVLAYAALGHSNKHIAYALGLAPTTVATHLAAAIAKLGLRSRRELIAVLGPMARVPARHERPHAAR
jgi:DNA-binding CsgD family transcriptional regulator